VVCILTAHQPKDPTAPVAYHSNDKKLFDEKLGAHGVTQAPFANRPVVVENDLDRILELLRSTSR
jgi:threonine synthase